MEITLIIVGGITLISIVGIVGDYLTRKVKAKGDSNPQLEAKVQELELRQRQLELALLDKDEKLAELSREMSFVNKLLEDKSGK